jgi:hypothetical protein
MTKPAPYWIAVVFMVALVLAKFGPESGFTSLIRFGDAWSERRSSLAGDLPIAVVPGSGGYDGQFYAQIALDPLLRSPDLSTALDSPAYRARRILAPGAAYVLGVGRPWWILQAYALINVISWLALGLLLYRLIPLDDPFRLARWLACMFSMGALESVRQSLVDLPSMVLLTVSIAVHLNNAPRESTLCSALAVLTKETSFLGAIALQIETPLRTLPWRRVGISLLACALPFVLWSLYVQQRFADATPEVSLGNFSWPLVGLFTQAQSALREVTLGNFDGRYSFGLAAMVGLSVQACFFWRNPQPRSAWWRVGAIYSLLLVFLSFWVWSGYWAACRALLPMTIAFNLLLPANRTFLPLWIVGNFTALHAVWRFL